MKSLLPTSIAVVITAVVTSVIHLAMVNSRIDRETGLHEQLVSRLLEMNAEITDINQRLDRLGRASASLEHAGNGLAYRMASGEESQPDLDDEALRVLIRDLIEEERAARHVTTKNTQWKRLREWQENREGPYGRFNARVNAMTRLLDLEYSQAAYYYTLLADYDEQANALYAGIGERVAGQASDPAVFQTVLDDADGEKRRLDETLDQAFIQTLSPEQANRYEQLPPEERGIGPNAGLSQVQFELGDLRKLAIIEE